MVEASVDTSTGERPAGNRIDILAVGHSAVLQVRRRLYRALARDGWRVELAIPQKLPWPSEPDPQPDHPDDPPIHRLPVKGDYLRTWSFEGLEKLMDERKPLIVYLENEPDSVIAWVAGRWCRRNDAKLVVNTNENDIPPVLPALLRRGPKTALRALRTQAWMLFNRRYVNWVMAICREGGAAMRAIGFADAVTVAPLGFDRDLFYSDSSRRASLRARLGLDRPVIAYFGRLAPNKGVHHLIAALGRIRHLDWTFMIDGIEHGDDAYIVQLRQAVRDAGIGERTVPFSASHDEIPDYMRAADIVVAPSTWREQYGRVAPEAMACGCVVIVSDMGALPELVGSAGLVFPSGSIGMLADRLAQLLENPERIQTLRAAAEKRAISALSIDRQVAILNVVFAKLLGRAGSSAAPMIGNDAL